MTGSNTYTGGTVISAGTLQLGDGGTTGSINGNVTDNGTLTFNRSDSVTFAGAISGTGTVNQIGTGTATLTGNSRYTGGLYIKAGTLQISNGGMVNVDVNGGAASYVGVDANLIVSGAGSSLTTTNDFVVGRGLGTATVTVNGGGHLTTSRSFLGEGSNYSSASAIDITVDGAGTVWNVGDLVQLSAAAGGTASLTISNGGVMMANAGGTGVIGGGGEGAALVTGAGSQLLLADELDIGSPFNNGTGHGQLTIANGGLVAATTVKIAFNDGTTIGQSGMLTVQGTPGARGVLETASLMRGHDDGSALFDGGILRASASSKTFIYTYGSDFVTIGAGGMFIDTNGFDDTVSSALMGAGMLTKMGTGTLTMTGANTYAGGTTISSGTLQLGDGGTTGSIAGDVADNGTLTLDRSDSVTFGGTISGTGAVNQIGTGTTVLTGHNTYTGGTTISAGTLQLGNGGTDGGIAGDVTDNGILAFNRSDSVTFGGAISGTGVVNQTGTGTTTLTGTNTYTGGTMIAAGTLTGSATSFGTGAILDNAALVIDQPSDADFANPINGSGSFTKQGAGRLNYTGSGTLTGPTTIAAGTLAVNGSLAGSAVTVRSGATLGGNGTVGATAVLAGGTVAPGNSIGTLHVNGAFTQNAGSVYQVEVDPTSSASDLILVNGTATIANGAAFNVTKNPAGDYRTDAQYTVLTASGGVSGSYAAAGDVAVSQYLALETQQDANNVYLRVIQTGDPASAADTSNQASTATGTDSLSGTSPVGSAVLNTPDPGTTRSAFDALSGEALASTKGVLISSSVLVRDVTFDRLRDVLCTDGPQDRQNRHAECVAATDRPSLWVQGFGDWGHMYGNANTASVSQTSGGFLVGADVPVWNWRLGVFGGYSRTDFDVATRASSGASDTYHLGAYGGTKLGEINLRLGASYSWSGIDTERLVAFDSFSNDLRASYNAGTTQIFGEAGRTFQLDNVSLEPFANLAYVNLGTEGFSETGGVAALTSRANTAQDTFTTIGVRPSTEITVGSVGVILRGMAGWRHAFGDITPNSIVSFAGGNAFTVAGAPIAEDAGVVEAGLGVDLSSNAAIGLTYGGQFSNRETDHSVRGTLSVSF